MDDLGVPLFQETTICGWLDPYYSIGKCPRFPMKLVCHSWKFGNAKLLEISPIPFPNGISSTATSTIWWAPIDRYWKILKPVWNLQFHGFSWTFFQLATFFWGNSWHGIEQSQAPGPLNLTPWVVRKPLEVRKIFQSGIGWVIHRSAWFCWDV